MSTMYPRLSTLLHPRYVLVPVILTAAMVMSGCANPFSSSAKNASAAESSSSARPQRGPTVSDSTIKDNIVEAFKQDPELAAANISVSAEQGVVSLSGNVPNVQAYLRAGSLARNVPGVRPPVNVANLKYAR